MINNTKKLLVILAAGAALTGVAHAESALVGEGAKASAKVMIVKRLKATNTLAKKDGLKSGYVNKDLTLATGTVASNDESEQKYAIAVTNGTENGNNWKVTGKADKANTLDVFLTFNQEGVEGKDKNQNKEAKIESKHYTTSVASAKSLPYIVVASSGQDIAADTYSIQTTAYIYNE